MSNSNGSRLPGRKLPKPKHGSHLHPPKCDACGYGMRIKRREAHPELGPKFELQTYACINCGHLRKRDTESAGAE